MSMATEYMDYGYFTGMDVPAPVPVDTEKKTQVYQATHDGYNKTLYGTRTPYRYRSFISFKFGGRNIEDFNLIATIDGDRMTRNVSAQFEDLTSSSDVVNGQLYHGTHYKANTLSFVLATDAIDQQMLEDFKNWFRGGEARPLILAEHPNREIMARVSQPPEISMLPFEKEVTLNIAGNEYKTSVTEYRGTIHLELVMDEPFWYSRVNIFGDVRDGVYIDTWEGVQLFSGNSSDEDVLKDVLKMIYEDGIPISSMVSVPMLFGDNLYAAAGNTLVSSIAVPYQSAEAWATDSGATITYNEETGKTTITGETTGYYYNGDEPEYYFPAPYDPENPDVHEYKYYRGAIIAEDNATSITAKGSIFGPYIKSAEVGGLPFLSGIEHGYNIYYAGTAPAPVEIQFTIPIEVSDGYVVSLYSDQIKNDNKNYSSMFLLEEKVQEMRITAPSLITSYNKAMSICKDTNLIQVGTAWQTVRERVQDQVRNPRIRAHLLDIIAKEEAGGPKITLDNLGNLQSAMGQFFARAKNLNENNEQSTLTVTINSRTGEAIGRYFIKYSSWVEGQEYDVKNDYFEENVGDMLSSNHLILENRNYFNKDTYTIMAWSEQHKNYSYLLYHDFPCDLSNFRITYKYLYY